MISKLSQTNQVHTARYYFLRIRSNVILLLRLGFPNGLFPLGFPHLPHNATFLIKICFKKYEESNNNRCVELNLYAFVTYFSAMLYDVL